MERMEKSAIAGLEDILDWLSERQQEIEGGLELLRNLTVKVDLPGIPEEKICLNLKGNVLSVGLTDSPEAEKRQSDVIEFLAENSKSRVAVGIARKIAETSDNIVIQGATGTGKNLLARYIHSRGPRSEHPLIWLGCGSIDSENSLSEAWRRAYNGTLYLDEVADLDNSIQKKLLTMIEETHDTNSCRIIASTTHHLEELTESGCFLAELQKLLWGCYIHLPDLCERPEDILPLARHYAARLCQKYSLKEKRLSPEYVQMLEIYPWPGNIRELINVLQQSLFTAGEQKTLFSKDLPKHIRIQTMQTAASRKQGI